MPKHFALVFQATLSVTGKFVDTGDDPCFQNPPTWGICRPNVRNATNLLTGSNLLFIAQIKTGRVSDYYLKGFFSVKEKIDIISAFNSYSNRRNVIISHSARITPNERWGNKEWKKACFDERDSIPDFLKSMRYGGAEYFQSNDDDHRIDNWKCRRVYNCKIESFKRCLGADVCLKESGSLKKNYIVGNEHDYAEWDHLLVPWSTVAPMINKPTELKRGNKHPEVELSLQDFLIIKEYMARLS